MTQLIVFTGLPGIGKSALAEQVGRKLGIPVFSKDWLEATLRRCGLMPGAQAGRDLGYASYELMTTLAARQIDIGQSAILVGAVSRERVRGQWRDLAAAYRARWRVIECVCSDESIHRQRLETAQPDIPGGYKMTWRDVEEVRAGFEPWTDDRLIVDTVRALRTNVRTVLAYLQSGRA
jgi:predicted kinase